MKARPIKVALDAQMALLENSLSRYIRHLVVNLVSGFAETLSLSLLVSSRRSQEDIRAMHEWIPPSVELVVLPLPENQYRWTRLEKLRLQFIEWPMALARGGFDIFHCQYNHLPPFAPCPLVTTVHDVFQWLPETLSVPGLGVSGHKPAVGLRWRTLHQLRRWIDRMIYRRASLILADSLHTRADFLTYVDPAHQQVRCVPLGVDHQAFSTAADPADDAKLEELGLGSQKYILYVGDLQPRKDLPTLLRAVASKRVELEGWKLVLAGAAWPNRTTEYELCHQLALDDTTLFLGRVTDNYLPTLYRHADIFVFPSLYEGFGLPVLEAMACGAPVVATNVSSLPEVVGQAARLFHPGDYESLGSLLVELCSSSQDREAMRQAGVAQAARFTWEKTARLVLNAYLDLYRSVLR